MEGTREREKKEEGQKERKGRRLMNKGEKGE